MFHSKDSVRQRWPGYASNYAAGSKVPAFHSSSIVQPRLFESVPSSRQLLNWREVFSRILLSDKRQLPSNTRSYNGCCMDRCWGQSLIAWEKARIVDVMRKVAKQPAGTNPDEIFTLLRHLERPVSLKSIDRPLRPWSSLPLERDHRCRRFRTAIERSIRAFLFPLSKFSAPSKTDLRGFAVV